MDEGDRHWRGVHISSLQTSLNLHQYPELISGQDDHTILVKLPVVPGQLPESYPPPSNSRDYWDQTHVKLPCSENNITKDHEHRWNIVLEEFTCVKSSRDLERAILKYNSRYSEKWKFPALHSFFEKVLESEETAHFFDVLFPKIVELALRLPVLITGGIPLLKLARKRSVSFSQIQIASLLANAFLCTFPHRNSNTPNSEYSHYPNINFNTLYQCSDSGRVRSIHEKLKCILNYFRRVTASAPTGIVTFSRQYVPTNMLPNWMESNNKLPKLYVSSSGSIEDDGFGLLQVDFANKFIGGGVLGSGCVQEEIRFVICPELILSRLFSQVMAKNDALIVIGCERFSSYQGYGHTFVWDGNYVDETPSDEYGRKYCTVVAINAICYQKNPRAQYRMDFVERDLNKAYAGFSWGNRRKKEELCAIATGNWGCGVFAGDLHLKSIIQLLAAAEAGRDLAYFTFGDEGLRDSMAVVHEFLTKNNVTVGKLCHLLRSYGAEKTYQRIRLFEFLITQDLREEGRAPNEESQSKYFSEKKTIETPSTSKFVIHRNSSFTEVNTNKTPSRTEQMVDYNCDSESSERREMIPEENFEEKRLIQDELQSISKFYDKANVSSGRNDFEALNQFKRKMKECFTNKPSLKEAETEMVDRLEKLETNLSDLPDLNESVKSNVDDESGQSGKSMDISLKKNDSADEDDVQQSPKEVSKVDTMVKKTEDTVVNSLERTGRTPVTSPTALGPLSQLSAKLTHRAAAKKKEIARVNSLQKRKIPNYFESWSGSPKRKP